MARHLAPCACSRDHDHNSRPRSRLRPRRPSRTHQSCWQLAGCIRSPTVWLVPPGERAEKRMV
jgi:hypothetical protein